jgi:DNA-binding Xre family transcriptional regulator
LLYTFKSGKNTINTSKDIMIQARFTDDFTIALIAPDGEKFIWNTLFPTPLQKQEYVSDKLAYYFEKYFKDYIGEKTGMGMQYWIWIRMNYDEGIAIQGGKGEKEDERIFLQQERKRIGGRIRELRKEKNIEARILAQQANIDAANLSRIEQGRYSVGLDVLSKIALALGTKIELIDFVNSQNS